MYHDCAPNSQGALMRLIILVGAIVGSYLGWALSENLGGDILVSFLVSSLFSGLGIFFGWRLGKYLLDL